MPSQPLNIPLVVPVVVRFGRVGDMVLQTPLLHLLHHRYGRPCRLITSGHWSSELLSESEDISDIWQLRARHMPYVLSPERWRLVNALRRHQGPVYVSEDIPRQIAKIRLLLAFAQIEPARCVFLNDELQQDDHWVDRLLRFGMRTPAAFRADDYPVSAEDMWTAPRLSILPSDRTARNEWLRRHHLDDRPLVLIQPGNKRAVKWGRQRRDDTKAWPTAHWAALIRAIDSSLPDARILLCGSPAEAGLLDDIRAAANVAGVLAISDDLPLRRMLALMESAHSMIAVDTGPAHMAAAIGCPLIVLYGAESSKTWGRRSPQNKPLIELGGPPAQDSAAEIPLQLVIEAWLRVKDALHRRQTQNPTDLPADTKA